MDVFSAIFQHQCLSHLSAYGHVLRLHKRPNILFAILIFFLSFAFLEQLRHLAAFWVEKIHLSISFIFGDFFCIDL